MSEPSHIPIFPRVGNRMVAINPALVRAVEAMPGSCRIVFDQAHEVLVDASFYEVIKSLWGPPAMSELKELTVEPA